MGFGVLSPRWEFRGAIGWPCSKRGFGRGVLLWFCSCNTAMKHGKVVRQNKVIMCLCIHVSLHACVCVCVCSALYIKN